jgi:hypothetical protein
VPDDLAVAPDEEFGKVPFDIATSSLRFQPSIERMRLLAIHIYLVKLWEMDVEVSR